MFFNKRSADPCGSQVVSKESASLVDSARFYSVLLHVINYYFIIIFLSLSSKHVKKLYLLSMFWLIGILFNQNV